MRGLSSQEVPPERTEAALSAADEALGQGAGLPPVGHSPRDSQPASISGTKDVHIPTRTVGDSGSLDDDSPGRQPVPVGAFAADVAVKPVADANTQDLGGSLPGGPLHTAFYDTAQLRLRHSPAGLCCSVPQIPASMHTAQAVMTHCHGRLLSLGLK